MKQQRLVYLLTICTPVSQKHLFLKKHMKTGFMESWTLFWNTLWLRGLPGTCKHKCLLKDPRRFPFSSFGRLYNSKQCTTEVKQASNSKLRRSVSVVSKQSNGFFWWGGGAQKWIKWNFDLPNLRTPMTFLLTNRMTECSPTYIYQHGRQKEGWCSSG